MYIGYQPCVRNGKIIQKSYNSVWVDFPQSIFYLVEQYITESIKKNKKQTNKKPNKPKEGMKSFLFWTW